MEDSEVALAAPVSVAQAVTRAAGREVRLSAVALEAHSREVHLVLDQSVLEAVAVTATWEDSASAVKADTGLVQAPVLGAVSAADSRHQLRLPLVGHSEVDQQAATPVVLALVVGVGPTAAYMREARLLPEPLAELPQALCLVAATEVGLQQVLVEEQERSEELVESSDDREDAPGSA